MGDISVRGWGGCGWMGGSEWFGGGGYQCKEILSNIFLWNFIKEFPCKLIGDLKQKILKRIPFNFYLGSFYKGFPWKIFFTRKSFVKFFLIFKLESDFFPHFLSKIRNNENCENLFILNYNWANFQQNQRTFFSHSSFIIPSRVQYVQDLRGFYFSSL